MSLNFEDIVNGKVNATPEQLQEALNETVRGFETLKDLNDFLVKLYPTDAYRTIRDIVQPKSNIIIRRAKTEDVEEYQKFQDIQRQAKQVFEYENKTATIFEVNKISTNIAQRFYGIAVRMISEVDDELGRAEQAINMIEERLGMTVTKFEKEGKSNDTTEYGNEQGIEKTTDGTGMDC